MASSSSSKSALELIPAFLPDLCPGKPFYVTVKVTRMWQTNLPSGVDPISTGLLVVDGKGNVMRAVTFQLHSCL
ncbi:hypothetical protein COLO4_23772 [Corchorus olitorius]|uniref:Nucleic acid-binding protein n=1 Tax=Corchorus olitorius TaxID=93759 RepID=A0A1R3IER5_9ROSI|nr:hypothetical protein COLO4_23772 [Corchorus olitorius]